MIKILIKFWPILLPLLLFVLWYVGYGKKMRHAKNHVHKPTELEVRLWNWTLLLSMVIAIACVLWVALTADSNIEGQYVPPKYEDGRVISGYKILPSESK